MGGFLMERRRKKKRINQYHVALNNVYRCTVASTTAFEALEIYAQTCHKDLQMALQEANAVVSSIYAKLSNGMIVYVTLA
jgi:hypothetical protein